ncbi:hypothetical protein FBUS_04730 [Fasciolopsis buskii]|uniref:Uncharacterized protein n=1 Tax=Fasciolopsis buskii TaxID=27845 RepID=A0A8E0VP77_9TREM|nr:hypothetical protein FBUS_04730 [Fasciolopsis buski]
MHVENQLRAVCCGNTEAEVHWTCPYPECSAPLSRLAQLQSCPLEDLLPVWKCADFFDQIRLRIVQRGGKQPRFYANPEAYPEAVLSVWSGPMHVFPSRSVEIFLRPAAVSVRFWPRLYYSPTGCTCEIHWPASCQAVGKYYRMRNAFGDSKCVISSAIPNYDGMQPLELPMPEGGRSKFYVNALRVAWRRNVIWKRHFSQKRVWTEFHYVDDINGRTIDEDKFIGWLETLIEMQTILEFLYVQMEFGSTGTEHNSYIAIMRRMELSMGRNLGIYPICRIITGNPRKDVKYTSKPVRRLALRVLNQRALSFELFRPRLLNVGNTS